MNDKNYYKEGDSRDVKILLAEDNPMNQKLAELILRQPFDPGELDEVIKKHIALQGHQRKISDDE